MCNFHSQSLISYFLNILAFSDILCIHEQNRKSYVRDRTVKVDKIQIRLINVSCRKHQTVTYGIIFDDNINRKLYDEQSSLGVFGK